MKSWKQRVKVLKSETYALYLAAKDPRVPWYAKALIFFVVAHTLSPVDLIPDFIPLLGYLDDLIIAPLGIAIAIKLIPPEILAECREKAQQMFAEDQPPNKWAAVVIITVWLLGALLLVAFLIRLIQSSLP
ncbi:MAG: YkvA family protein [Anaerolineales bacterium]|jgi:uncharacterized membrane protein YkvA (DUF1232 family)